MHLLQHKLQVLHSSVLVRICQQELEIDRSIAVIVISFGCSAAHYNIISDSMITPAKNASIFFDHCWKSSSRPVNSFRRPRPFTSMRLGVSFRTSSCREIVDSSHCLGKSRLCCHLCTQKEYFLLKLGDHLLHGHRHRSSSG